MESEALELLKSILKLAKVCKSDLEYKNEAEKRQKAFQLLLKLQWHAFLGQNEGEDFKILTPGLPKPFKIDPENDASYVPDTCHIQEDEKELFEDEKDEDFRIIPETQDGFQNGYPILERRIQNFDTICPDVEEDFAVFEEPAKPQKTMDEIIREKYPPLMTISTSSDNESPSVLDRLDRKKKKNALGMTIENTPNSQVNLKQSSIKDIFQTSAKKRGKFDQDMEKAIKESLSDPFESANKRGKYDPDMEKALKESLENSSRFANGDQSKSDEKSPKFGTISKNILENSPDLFDQPRPVGKSKAERAKMFGFSCKDCEKFYENQNLTDEQLKKVIDKCSRHRATIEPPCESPKEMWNIDIDGPDNKTQIGSPLKTRERRKLNRLSKRKS